MLNRAALKEVRILPGLFRRRMDLNEAYLLELDSTCLLQNFYLEAGIILPVSFAATSWATGSPRRPRFAHAVTNRSSGQNWTILFLNSPAVSS